jgi:hypothetical protein
MIGAPLPAWDKKTRKHTAVPKPQGQRVRLKPKGISYANIKKEVTQAILELSAAKRAQIPAMGTLPEQLAALGLVWLGFHFSCQISENGGRLRVGGSVIDIILYMGNTKTAIRIDGDYWHSLPGRKQKDIVQLNILRMKGYLVVSILESDLYKAWAEQRLGPFMRDKVMEAA